MSEYQTLRGQEGDDDDLDQNRQQGDWKDNMAQFGKKFGEQLNVFGQKVTEQASVVGDKMKDLFATPTIGDKLADEATSDVLIGPDWSKNLAICDLVNSGRVPGVDVVRGIKRKLSFKNGHVQLLALSLLETALKNCSSMFSDVASEKVLDVMVRIVDDPTTPVALREKCLKLIESWGEATEELRYLPVFEETYKSLKMRGIVFPPRDAESLVPIFTPPAAPGAAPPPGAGVPVPVHAAPPSYASALGAGGIDSAASMFAYGGVPEVGVRSVDGPEGRVIVLDSKEILSVARNSTELLGTVLTSAPPEEVLKDEVTISLVTQCRSSKRSVQQLVENESSNETLLFEALTVNDELDKVLDKYEELRKQVNPPATEVSSTNTPSSIPAAAAPSIPTQSQRSDHLADLLAPPQALPLSGNPPPMTSFSVPSMEHENDGESLVRNRGGGGMAGLVSTGSEDDRALAELDAMVFGKGGAPGVSAGQGATGAQGDEKKKEDDLIVF